MLRCFWGHKRKVNKKYMTTTSESVSKFDNTRAGEYEQQSRIALAGYDACHELAACLLAASIGSGKQAEILVGGAGGTAKEIITTGALELNWRFTAVDPSQSMMDIAVEKIKLAGLTQRVEIVLGVIEDLPKDKRYDAATLIGVIHHLSGDEAKIKILSAIAQRLNPNAPLILAGNRYAYKSQPLFLSAWGERWRMTGSTPDEIKIKLGKILLGADPPHSEQEVFNLLDKAGFEKPLCFFSSLYWAAWICYRKN